MVVWSQWLEIEKKNEFNIVIENKAVHFAKPGL